MHLPSGAVEMTGEFVADLDGDLVDEAGQGRIAQARDQSLHRRGMVGKAVGLPLSLVDLRIDRPAPFG